VNWVTTNTGNPDYECYYPNEPHIGSSYLQYPSSGKCQDSGNNSYNYVDASRQVSAQACAAACESLTCTGFQANHMGLSYNGSTEDCFCHVENAVTSCSNPDSYAFNTDPAQRASGGVGATDATATGFTCYAVVPY
jgi:hypothetical protein